MIRILLFILCVVAAALGLAWFADTGAYFAGRFIGRHNQIFWGEPFGKRRHAG